MLTNPRLGVYGVRMTAVFARKGRATASIVAAIIALVAIPAGIAGPVAAAPDSSSSPVEKYVALGDSVAAGQGGGGYVDACLRSPAGYPALLDAEPKVNLLRNAACTGASISDVIASQLQQVNRGTTLVTVTVGANNVDLPAIYAACVSGLPTPECVAALVEAETYLLSGQLQTELGALLTSISARAPNAQIVVTGYPIPFAPGLSEITDIVNSLVAGLNTALSSTVAGAAGQGVPVAYAPVDFSGHVYGSGGVPWIGVDPTDLVTFLHPTPAGYLVYRDAILTALG
jgi:lysophospholipase L1-like esterase